MNSERTAKKPHRRDTVAVLAHAANGGLFDSRIGGEAEIVIRRQHDRIFACHAYDSALFGLDDGFLLECLRLLEPAELAAYCVVQIHGFKITLNASPRPMRAIASSN